MPVDGNSRIGPTKDFDRRLSEGHERDGRTAADEQSADFARSQDRFRQALDGRDRARPGTDQKGDDAKRNEGKRGLGDAILAGVGSLGGTPSGPLNPAPPAPVAGPATMGTAASTAEVAQQIVDRILLSEGTAEGGQEVRISLRQEVLANTEIRIVRTETDLTVSLISDDGVSLSVLTKAQDALVDRLTTALSAGGRDLTVRVAVLENGAQAVTGGEASHGEHGQGRSRQHRNLYDEMGKEES